MNKEKLLKKSGKEISELYKKWTKKGITPEEGMFFLLAHMQKTKAITIGMDVTGEDGHTFCMVVNVKDGSINEQEDFLPSVKIEKFKTPSVY